MSDNLIFTLSNEGTQEYCCNIIQVGECIPIEGSDFLVKTFINGESVVIRKDEVKEGDIMFFAAHETALSREFLSNNNLYEGSCYDMNNSKEDVQPIIDEIQKLKKEIKELESSIKVVAKLSYSSISKTAKLEEGIDPVKKFLNILVNRSKNLETDTKEEITNLLAKSKTKTSASKKIVVYLTQKRNDVATLKDDIEKLRLNMKPYIGFFNKYGRVKSIRLKGVTSHGFLFGMEPLIKAFPEYEEELSSFNMKDNIGLDFDTVGNKKFIQVYIPPIKEGKVTGTAGIKKQKTPKFDRMIPGEFNFHYDTNPLGKNMQKIQPNDSITISVKVHGTSAIFSNVKVKFPIKLNFIKKGINKVSSLLFKKEIFPTYYIDYDEVYSSRKVIKNNDINTGVNGGYYSADVWGFFAEMLKGLVPKGFTLYGEIVGYVPGNSEKMIQKDYDYKCEKGNAKLMLYRISEVLEDGTTKEYNVDEVAMWQNDLILSHPELSEYMFTIPIVYHGMASDLYPELSIDNHWHSNFYMSLMNDKNFYMEEDEPLCNNKVPREGLIIRINDDEQLEAFKAKTEYFREWERKGIDNGEIDTEILETL